MKRVQDLLGARLVDPAKRNLSWIRQRLYRDDDRNPAHSIFICGAGRSGTTWLVELLNGTNEHRMVYEPFNCDRVRLCRHFSERQYLRPSDSDPAYLEPARAVFSGALRDPWIDQYNKCRDAKSRLIKDVRSTLMLKWIRGHFPTMPIIFIMRHPCAVALSRLDMGWRTDLKETVFCRQPQLISDHLAPLIEQVAWADEPFERYLVDWCIENYVPLAQLEAKDTYFLFYEHLAADPSDELRKLCAFLGRPFDESMLQRRDERSASSRRRQGNLGTVRSKDHLIEGWRKHVSSKNLESAARIADIFGLADIYRDSMPDPRAVETKLANNGRPLVGKEG